MKNYLEILYIEKLLENNPLKIRRKEKIYAKLPSKEDIGKELINYWIDRNGRFQIEDKTIIESDLIIARHEEPIGEINEIAVYKEWLIPYDMWMRDYGIKPTEEFKPYNQKIINVVEITDKILDLLGSKNGKSAVIEAIWSENGQKVYKDGVLTAEGFGISPKDLNDLYEKI